MYDFVSLQEHQGSQYLFSVLLYGLLTEPSEASPFEMLKHVPRLKQLKDEAMMVAEVELIDQPDYVMLVLRVLLH